MVSFDYRVIGPKDAEGMANSVDTDQTAPLGAVWSGSTQFAQTCLSENLGSLQYYTLMIVWYKVQDLVVMKWVGT